MAYRDIKGIVKKGFESTQNLRIEHTIEEKGASSLISGVFTNEDAEERKFYRKPELAEGEETKLAILYGETMITPYIIDLGTSTGRTESENITRTVRFIAGDGETEGVVVGPNGSILENVYMGSAGENPQPVIDDSGRPSTKDILVASALGGLVQSVPAIWDAIFDDTPDEDKVGEVDPITGGKILTDEEKKQLATLGENLAVEGLSDVEPEESKDGDDILYWDNCYKTWRIGHFTELLNRWLDITPGTEGSAGTVGTPGTPGTPAIPASPEVVVPADPFQMPDGSLTKEDPTLNKLCAPVTDMVCLIDISDLENNQYFESRPGLNTDGIVLHFYFDGIGLGYTWVDTNANDPDSDAPCFVAEQTNNPNEVSHIGPGTVDVNVCISVDVCGEEYAIFENRWTFTGQSNTDFTRHVYIKWVEDENDPEGTLYADQNLATLFKRYGDQMGSTLNIRLRRVDGLQLGGEPTSIYPVRYQGATMIHGNEWIFEELASENVAQYPYLPPEVSVIDDGQYPDDAPLNSGLGPNTCPTRLGYIIPEQPGTPAIPPVDPVPGTPGTPTTPTIVQPKPDPNTPSLVLDKPFSTKYCPDEDGSNPPHVYDLSDLAKIKAINPGIGGAVNATIDYVIVQGSIGTVFVIDGTLPGTVNFVFSQQDRQLTLTGPIADLPAAAEIIKIQADDDEEGEVHYKISLRNDEGECDGMILKVMPCSTEEVDKSACATLTIDTLTADTGSIRIYAEQVPANDTEGTISKELTSGAVPKTNGQTRADYVLSVANDMQSNINTKNANPQLVDGQVNPDWLPAYVVTVVNTDTIKVCAPVGDEFNGLSLTYDTAGDVDVDLFDSLLDFFGGNRRNIFNTVANEAGSVWDTVGDVLLNIAGNVAGAAVVNMLFNDASTISIEYPEQDKDITVTFIYKGRKVKMPTVYDGTARTGALDYDSWVGDWDNNVNTKTEWTDNPAWCLMDYIENRKFGLGDEIEYSGTQKEELLRDIFKIAQYCDEDVDGSPRFSLNTAITSGTKIQVLEQLCSVFFGSFVFHKGGLRIKADQPDTDVKLLVNQANAGDFVYEHTTLKSFINKVNVTYVDPNSYYVERTISVENSFGIDKYGEKSVDVFGFGITDREQAIRYGNWILQSEKRNTLLVNYVGGWDHYNLVPGELVQFEDSNDRLYRLAGRVSSNSGTTVNFDGAVTAVAGDTLSITQTDGSITEFVIDTVTDADTVEVTTFTTGDLSGYTFIITPQAENKQLYRVVSVNETSDGSFNTTLQLYSTDKYNYITNSVRN